MKSTRKIKARDLSPREYFWTGCVMNDGAYRHLEIRVSHRPYYAESGNSSDWCTDVIEFTWQFHGTLAPYYKADEKHWKSHQSALTAYGLYAKIQPCENEADAALRILGKIHKTCRYDGRPKTIIRALAKMGIRREVYIANDGSGRHIPRRYKNIGESFLVAQGLVA